jgi:hypothetical protein
MDLFDIEAAWVGGRNVERNRFDLPSGQSLFKIHGKRDIAVGAGAGGVVRPHGYAVDVVQRVAQGVGHNGRSLRITDLETLSRRCRAIDVRVFIVVWEA